MKTFSLIKRFFPYYKPYKFAFAADILCCLAVIGVDLSFPMIVRHILNDGLSSSGLNLSVILSSSVLLLVLRIFDLFFNYYISCCGHVMGSKIETDMRSKLFNHLEKMSFSYYDNTKVGYLMSRLTTDLFDIAEFAHHCPEEFLSAAVKIIGSFIILSTISLKVTAVVFSMFPFMIAFSFIYNGRMRKAFRLQREQIAEINANAEDSLGGIRVVKSFANEDIEREKFEKNNKKFLNIKKMTYRYMGIFNSGVRFFDGLIYLSAVLFGSLFIMDGSIEVSDLVAFLLYISTLLSAVSRAVQFTEQFQRGLSGFQRYTEIMDTSADIVDSSDAVSVENVKGDISFNNVTFSYSEGSGEVLTHIDLKVKRGETVAIVGPSGGGKSTLCSLIPRFYDVGDGSITIDDIDIRKITQKSLRKNIGVVQQDVYLFGGTIRENIEYGKPGATFEEIVEAAKKAGADGFISELENGYDTDVGERGVRLSGGQKQRIAIARVFLKNPPVLILDEATSALDNENEKIVQKSLETLSKGRTTFIIAHRLTTVRNASEIIVLTKNGIEEKGTHSELIKKGGVYSELYALYST